METVIGRDDAFYATHYGPGSGWEIHRLNVCISIPAKGGSPSESLNLIREILDNANFDIRVTELTRAEPTDLEGGR